jgi:hypothetical protein
MAGYKDVLKLIREGKTSAQIREAIPMSPYDLKRILCGNRLIAELAEDRQLAEKLSRHHLAASLDRLMQRRLEIAESEEDNHAGKAAGELIEEWYMPAWKKAAGKAQEKVDPKELDREQKIKFIGQLMRAQEVGTHLLCRNRHTGKLGFEEVIENTDLILAQIDRGERLSWNERNTQNTAAKTAK